MKTTVFALVMALALLSEAAALHAIDILSDEGVKCTYTHHDMWKGKISGEGMLFLGMYWESENVYVVWGKNRDELVQQEKFSLNKPEPEKDKGNSKPKAVLPWYQEFTDMLKKALEWETAADANDLEDIHKPIALKWAYHKLKKGSSGWISRTWGGDGKYELVEVKIEEIPKLLTMLEGVPDLDKKLKEDRKILKDESDRKKAEEKARKDKVDNLLK
jgi:hypothetical protein